MARLGELMMILELHRPGWSVTAIVRRCGRDPKTVRKYIERAIEPSAYGPRAVGMSSPNRLFFRRARLARDPSWKPVWSCGGGSTRARGSAGVSTGCPATMASARFHRANAGAVLAEYPEAGALELFLAPLPTNDPERALKARIAVPTTPEARLELACKGEVAVQQQETFGKVQWPPDYLCRIVDLANS